jgi:hypothetical protein
MKTVVRFLTASQSRHDRAPAVVIVLIDVHRARFEVAPICRVPSQHGVRIAPSNSNAARTRSRAARSIADEAMRTEITRAHSDPAIGRGLYGAARCGTSYDSLAESVNGLFKAECVGHEGLVRTVGDLELRTVTCGSTGSTRPGCTHAPWVTSRRSSSSKRHTVRATPHSIRWYQDWPATEHQTVHLSFSSEVRLRGEPWRRGAERGDL